MSKMGIIKLETKRPLIINNKRMTKMIGKHYLITGATGSLGECLITHLNKRGAFVTIVVRNKEKAAQLQLRHKNIKKVIILDLANTKEVENFSFDNTYKYDGIINNAGVGYFKDNDSHSQIEIQNIYNINLVNLIIFLNSCMSILKRGASIVNIASLSGKVTTPYASHYAASKAGLIHFTNALRLEQEHLHIMTVNTGPFVSQFHSIADPTGTFEKLTQSIQLDIDDLANSIAEGIIHKDIELNKPEWMDLGLRIYGLAPRTFEKIFKKAFLSKKI